MLWRKRQLLGCKFLAKEDSMRATVRLLSKGTSMGFLVDQRIDSGELIPFFGVAAPTTSSPARLALRLGCDLIPVQVERLQGAHFRVTFHAPLKPDDEQADKVTQALQLTGKLNALFETWIRQHPQQWLCTKRRWPKTVTRVSDGR
jgi:KDO2-lipid IV(A) lauroyltransferase